MLAHGGIAILALVFAIAFAAFELADAVAQAVVTAIQYELLDPESGDSGLSIRRPVLAAVIALGLVGLVAVAMVRLRDKELSACPFCASRIPYESRHCAYCGSGVKPAGS